MRITRDGTEVSRANELGSYYRTEEQIAVDVVFITGLTELKNVFVHTAWAHARAHVQNTDSL